MRDSDERDAGITMLEMVIGLSIMSVLMVLVTTAVTQIYKTYNKVDATNQAQQQVNTVFLRLDKEIRYATGITAGLNNGASSVIEYQLVLEGAKNCVQLRVRTDTGTLERRSWAAKGGTVPTTWTTLLSGIGLVPAASATPTLTGGATAAPPLTRLAPTEAQDYQRLRLYFTTKGGGAAASTTRLTDITFTALNTSGSLNSDNLCVEGRTGL
ncbi:type II secretion system protein J [Catenuloplanes sp. NPDC051500]|uniref:type II secretion system protein J n=1 Tax=Catenuloplanes sp. NPDC051500 TaxID=3363959 RepID=UPI0037AD9578